MHKGILLTLACCICLLAPAALAEEAVRFTDGRYLEVAAHHLDGDWIELQLPGLQLYVPASRVDRIERAGRVLYARPGVVEAEELRRARLIRERRPEARPVLTSALERRR